MEHEVPDEMNSDARAQEVSVGTAVLDGNSNHVVIQNEVNNPINKLYISSAFFNHVIWPAEFIKKIYKSKERKTSPRGIL